VERTNAESSRYVIITIVTSSVIYQKSECRDCDVIYFTEQKM